MRLLSGLEVGSPRGRLSPLSVMGILKDSDFFYIFFCVGIFMIFLNVFSVFIMRCGTLFSFFSRICMYVIFVLRFSILNCFSRVGF